MTIDPITLSQSKVHVKRKLLISLIALALGLTAGVIMSNEIYMKIVVAILLCAFILHQGKTVRYFRLSQSKNLEVINAGFSSAQATKTTTLPFKISIIFVIAILAVYLLSAFAKMNLGQILIGLSVFLSLMNNSRKEIIFDYDNSDFYGLWKSPSFYDSDKQSMKRVRFSPGGDSDDKIKVSEKDEYYFINKKDYTENVWKSILMNIERIEELNMATPV